jgi:DNA-binding XRE family transcriptional regulator
MSETNPETPEQAAARTVLVRRGELGLTQQEAADLAGVNVDTFRDVERGRLRPRVTTVAAIARALELDADTLQVLAAGQIAQAS